MAVRTQIRLSCWFWNARDCRWQDRRDWPGVSLPALLRGAAMKADYSSGHGSHSHRVIEVSDEFHRFIVS